MLQVGTILFLARAAIAAIAVFVLTSATNAAITSLLMSVSIVGLFLAFFFSAVSLVYFGVCWTWGTHHQLCGTSKCLCGAFFLRFVFKFSTLETYSWFCFPSGWSSIVCWHSQKCLASCKWIRHGREFSVCRPHRTTGQRVQICTCKPDLCHACLCLWW